VVRAIGLYSALFGVWLLLSGFFSPFFLGLAVLCCALVVAIVLRMDAVDHTPLPFSLNWRLFSYLPWLAWQVVVANIDVARRVLSRDLAIDPRLDWVPANQKSDLGTAVHANSITLTPGTISTSVEAGRILVHALSSDGIDELEQGAMDRRVSDIEG
jgi:multicomponent Na+:H+ antiporter subunit E